MGYWCAVASILAFAAVALASVGDNTLDGGERVVLVSPVLAPPRDSGVSNGALRARQFPVLVLLSRQSPPDSVREHEAKSLDRNPRPIYVKKLEDKEVPGRSNRQRRHLHKHFSHYGGGGYSGGGGFGGGYGGGYDSGYQQPTKTIVVNIVKEGHGGGHHGGGGGYPSGGGGGYPSGGGGGGYGGGYGGGGGFGGGGGYGGGGGGGGGGGYGGGGYPSQGGGGYPSQGGGCGGGCGGGGGGGGHATATATATATASAYSNSYSYRKR